ncbi:MAG: sulfite exporter TauE/SafE family protein [Bryobacter sp.]|nr:sulfite exporter TauE/SafE family protein [Bryobacter sp.]
MESVIGFVIALVVGMTGAGGGPLTVPLLVLVLGRSAAESVGTSLAFVFLIKLVASPLHIARGNVHWRTLALMLAGGLPGVALGSWVLLHLSRKAIEPILLPLVGCTIALLALLRLLKPGEVSRPSEEKPHRLPLATLPIGMEVGFSSAGAGALGGLLLMYQTQLSAAAIVGTDLLFGLGLSLAGSGIHAFFGRIEQDLILKLLIGGVPGALVGSWLSSRVPGRNLQFAMNLVFGYLGIHMSWKGIGALLGH